jgi:hypothetical protein
MDPFVTICCLIMLFGTVMWFGAAWWRTELLLDAEQKTLTTVRAKLRLKESVNTRQGQLYEHHELAKDVFARVFAAGQIAAEAHTPWTGNPFSPSVHGSKHAAWFQGWQRGTDVTKDRHRRNIPAPNGKPTLKVPELEEMMSRTIHLHEQTGTNCLSNACDDVFGRSAPPSARCQYSIYDHPYRFLVLHRMGDGDNECNAFSLPADFLESTTRDDLIRWLRAILPLVPRWGHLPGNRILGGLIVPHGDFSDLDDIARQLGGKVV